MPKPAKQPHAAPQTRKARSNQPDRVHAAIQAAKQARARSREGTDEVYERIDKLAREIGLTNLAKLDQVSKTIAHQQTDQIKAAWSKATGGASLPPELDKHLKEYIADTQTYTAPLADAARLELSTKAAGLPTPFEREGQRRRLIKEKEQETVRNRRNGKKTWQGREDEKTAHDEQKQKIQERAEQLKADGVKNYLQVIIGEGLAKKINADGLDENLSEKQVSRMANETDKIPRKK